MFNATLDKREKGWTIGVTVKNREEANILIAEHEASNPTKLEYGIKKLPDGFRVKVYQSTLSDAQALIASEFKRQRTAA